MLHAIALTLSVFDRPEKDRWPYQRLLTFLKSAEEMARDMLCEIAERLHVVASPVRVSAQREPSQTSSNRMGARAPYFRLGVSALENNTGDADETGCSAEQSEFESHIIAAQAQVPASSEEQHRAQTANAAGKLQNRLTALEDVLANPGKHAARMARAQHRRAHGIKGGHLAVKDDDDVILDFANRVLVDSLYDAKQLEIETMAKAKQFVIDTS